MIEKARAIREEHKLERRQEILDAAERLFLSRPDGLASMDELAVAAGVAKGTLYLYFPSKEEVLLALHERNVQALFDVLDREIAAKAERFTLDDLSRLARDLIVESPLYLPLTTQVMGFIGRSIPVESVVRLHMSIYERVAQTGEALERVFRLPAGDGRRLLEYTHAFVIGLWQASGCGRIVADNVRDCCPDVLHMMADGPADYQRALEALWTGLLPGTRLKPTALRRAPRKKQPARKRS